MFILIYSSSIQFFILSRIFLNHNTILGLNVFQYF